MFGYVATIAIAITNTFDKTADFVFNSSKATVARPRFQLIQKIQLIVAGIFKLLKSVQIFDISRGKERLLVRLMHKILSHGKVCVRFGIFSELPSDKRNVGVCLGAWKC